jgi:hypothetical protein
MIAKSEKQSKREVIPAQNEELIQLGEERHSPLSRMQVLLNLLFALIIRVLLSLFPAA